MDDCPGLCIKKMHMTFLLVYSTKDKQRIYIKNLKPHTTPTDPTMGEDHVNRALCSEDNKISPSDRE
jgi:hypothetical protein